jgi:hypothetical protein
MLGLLLVDDIRRGTKLIKVLYLLIVDLMCIKLN